MKPKPGYRAGEFTPGQIDALIRACVLMMAAHENGDYSGMTGPQVLALGQAFATLTQMSVHYHRHFCLECGLCICACRECTTLGMCCCDDCPSEEAMHECSCPSTVALIESEARGGAAAD